MFVFFNLHPAADYCMLRADEFDNTKFYQHTTNEKGISHYRCVINITNFEKGKRAIVHA